MEYAKALQQLQMPLPKYAVRYGLPILGGGLVVAVLIFLFVGPLVPLFMRPFLPLLVVAFAVLTAVMYPVALNDRRRMEINHAIPFFMTHFGVLAHSNISRTEIFRILGEKKSYNALADELMRIYSLVTNWNLSLPQAARFVSQTTPSEIFGDFLDRLAHAIETGQELEVFLRNEQTVVMKEYATVYETSIYQIEQWKDIYTSVLMSGIFFVIFAIITPILSDLDPGSLLVGILIFFVFMELLLLFVLKMRVPHDQLWHSLDIPTAERTRIRTLLGATALASGLLLLTLPAAGILPFGISLAVAVTPLAAVGVFARNAETRIKRREDNYGAFIRGLGASAAARGGSLREVLKRVKAHNFGPLSEMVHNLYARLTWRLHDVLAWKRFSAESGSNLVENFNDMFVEGVRSGAKPDIVGDIISRNVVRILNLRKSRYSAAGTFRGLLFGLTASMAFVLFTGVGIIEVLSHLFSASTTAGAGDLNPIQVDFSIPVHIIENSILLLILFHCLVASLMLKLVDGGGFPAGLGAFVIMMWLGVGLGFVSVRIMSSIFSIGPG
jgi:archaeal flagellar protein FlaJ